MSKGEGQKKLDLIPTFFTEIIQSSFNLMKLLAQRKDRNTTGIALVMN